MLILAPMQGLTELLFRRAFQRCYPGAFDMAVSPFLSITHGNLRDAGKKIDDVLPEANEGSIPVVPQLLGREPEGFVDLANRLYDIGYNEINWNMGCPMRRVAHKHRGSGILPYPDEVCEILDFVVPKMKSRLSVKLRLGYYSSDEIDCIIPILNDYPLLNVTVHPRIGKQIYSGLPDMVKFEEILPAIKHPVIYNGDVNTVYDYKKIRTSFPVVKDVMIGRGALYNPLLPIMIRNEFAADFVNSQTMRTENYPSVGQFIETLMNDIMKSSMTRQAKSRKMKEYWCMLGKSLPQSEEQKRRVLHAVDLEDILNLILEMAK